MKKRNSVRLLGFSVLVTLFFSCQKQVDTPDADSAPGEEVITTPPPMSPTYCRIESFWENAGLPGQKFILVLYDEYENPIAITQPAVGTGHPYRTFKYDQWHRLREHRGEYANGHFEFWHFYGFDNNGRIGVDTAYIFGQMGPTGPLNWFERRISHYTYDVQGRIIKVNTVSTLSPPSEQNYSYDASGNRVYPPAMGIVYDNKMNFLRTNDIWQFLHHDYSMNNPFVAAAYNATNLPTVINAAHPNIGFFEWHAANSQIGYGCRESHW